MNHELISRLKSENRRGLNAPILLSSKESYQLLPAYQAELIDSYLSEAVKTVPFYTRQINRYTGIDHHNYYLLPLVQPADLLQDPYQFIPEKSEITQMSSSGGTYGKRKLLFRTEEDSASSIETASSMFIMAGVNNADVVSIMQPFDLWNIGHLGMSAFKEIGALTIPFGLSAKEDDLLDLLAYTHTSVLYATPTKAAAIAVLSEERGVASDMRISRVLCAGEPITISQRDIIRRVWNAEVFGIYGSEETDGIGAECTAHDGYHALDKNLLIEILNPDTFEPAEKPEGVIAVTKLGYNGTTLIRYLLGDKIQLATKRCPCGIESPRIYPRGRLEETLWLFAGTKIATSSIDEMLMHVYTSLPQYQVVIERMQSKDIFRLKILDGSNLTSAQTTSERINMEIKKISQDLNACLDSGRIELNIELGSNFSIFESSVRGKIPKIIYKERT